MHMKLEHNTVADENRTSDFFCVLIYFSLSYEKQNCVAKTSLLVKTKTYFVSNTIAQIFGIDIVNYLKKITQNTQAL